MSTAQQQLHALAGQAMRRRAITVGLLRAHDNFAAGADLDGAKCGVEPAGGDARDIL